MKRNRRSVLRLSALAGAGVLAGCSSLTGDAEPTDAGSEQSADSDTERTDTDPAQRPTAEFDYGGWFDGVDNYDGTTIDARGDGQVTVSVGADGNGGAFAFDPPAVWVDPGTTIVWEWSGDGGKHNVVDDGDGFRSGVPTEGDTTTFEYTLDEDGIYRYFCSPHRTLGMKGAVVVGDAEDGGETTQQYDWQAATFDSYWYSLYNMSTNIAMSGNGVPFPLNDQMEQLRDRRLPAMLERAAVDRPPITDPNLSFAAFTSGDPSFTQQPVLDDETGRPDAKTLAWDSQESSGVVSPSSLAWTHLKGVTWAKNFQKHFELLPQEMAPKFRAQLLSTLAQVGINAAILSGGSRGNGALTHGDSFEFLSEYRPAEGRIEDETRRPHHYAAMLWFLSDMTSLAQNGWFGYVNPLPLIPTEAGEDAVFDPPVGIQEITDGVAATTMERFSPDAVASQESTRSVGLMLGAVGYYGPQAGSAERRQTAAEYANGLAAVVEDNLDDDARVENGAENQAATQGIVAQGLLWASELDGVDYTDTAETVLDYMVDELWDEDAGTFASGVDDDVYTISARDAGDITGGINAADAVLGRSDLRPVFARFFDETFNTGRLQRAQRPQSVDGRENEPPLPPEAGGEYGQAAVYNGEIAYDTTTGEWTVTDDSFRTAEALYLANQDIWVGNWGGDFYQGRGVPGQADDPPN